MAEPIPLPPSQTVTVTGLLIPLMRICGLAVCLGICFAVDALCRAFFGTVSGAVGWIPWFGSVAERGIHDIEHKVSSFLGGLEAHIDPSMGWYVHLLADRVGALADGTAEAGWVAWLIAQALHVTRATVAQLPSIGRVVHGSTVIVKQVRTIVKNVYHVGKIAVAAAPGITVAKLAAVAGTLDHVIEWDIPRLRARTKVLEGDVARAWDWIRSHKTVLGAGAATAAVAWALARLGVSWIRCSNWKRVGKEVCGTPIGDIEGFLAIALGAAAIADMRELVKLAQTVEHGAAQGMKDLLQV